GPGGRSRRPALDRRHPVTALQAELGAGRQLGSALRARQREPGATLETELRALGILATTRRAEHQRTRRQPSARACSSASRTARPFWRAIRRTSSNSGVTVTTRPANRETL